MKKNDTQKDYVKRTTRYPPELFAEIDEERIKTGASFNAQVIARLLTNQQFAELKREIAELKAMLREVLDRVRD